MQKYSKYLGIALGLGFLLIALVAFINGQPQKRDRQVYAQLKPYIPYKIEKKMSGLFIRDTNTNKKIEPSNAEVYKVLDNLEKDWGEKYLRREGNTLIVVNDKNETLKQIPLNTLSAQKYVHDFFGL
ncbi:MAG: hypothetical protein DSZ05_00220 [Sulfurospirillum sp.]|nr:MAG: hypothetical protein DSZ05_00220 [Sulfurospirillum sp.]